MNESETVYFPDQNTGMEMKGISIGEIESMLGEHSVLDATGFRKASPSDLPDETMKFQSNNYIQEYEIPYFEGDDHLDPQPQIASVYSVASKDGHYFIAENEEVARHLPEVNLDFYQEPR